MAFSYGISLQVRHPAANPDDVATGIGLPVKRQWKADETRTTQRGTALPGRRRETYCVFDLGAGDDGELAEHLRQVVASLVPRRAFIWELRATGGSLILYVTWNPGERGEVFDHALLSDLASLGIDLGIEPLGTDRSQSVACDPDRAQAASPTSTDDQSITVPLD